MKSRRMVRRGIGLVLCLTLALGGISGCGAIPTKEEDGKINVITTLFPYYDFVRQVGGNKINLTMIVPAGMDTHSFEPTAKDMVTIGEADLLIYNGGSMETWVTSVLEAAEGKELETRCMMDYVEVVEEEHVEGMQEDHEHDEEEGEHEQDEHIWTSPVNAIRIVEEIKQALCKMDPENKAYYEKNATAYQGKLEKLDREIQETVAGGVRKELVFGDRFPLRYFTEAYGLSYRAAFAGCSADTEPSADTIAYLIDQIEKKQIPAVLKIELSSSKVADTIAESTGVPVMTFSSCHNVTKEQMEQGITYLEQMEDNVDVLKKVLY